jgi:adenosine deaminase
MVTRDACLALPKVELHVHLEGSIRPETVLELARKNSVALPADTVDGLRDWYRFTNFAHFVEIYTTVSSCIRSAEDIEFVAREFLEGQREQNIFHSEFTYTALTQRTHSGIPLGEQMEALSSALDYARDTLGISAGVVLDFTRESDVFEARELCELAVAWHGRGVVALGLSGFESVGAAFHHRETFAYARHMGLPIVPHAGETQGAASIQEAVDLCEPPRIGHGVRVLEDDLLTDRLAKAGTVLEVCPSSNVCLGVAPALEAHPLPHLMERGLVVTINSDDPPMFGTTLTDEFHRCAQAFGWGLPTLERLCRTAAEAALISEDERGVLFSRMGLS